MLSAEALGEERDLHRIGEHIGDDLGVLGVVSHGDEADSLDEQYLRCITLLADESLDLLLRLLQDLFVRFCINEYVGALAVHDDVRRKRLRDHLEVPVDEIIHKGVLGDFQGLEASAGA